MVTKSCADCPCDLIAQLCRYSGDPKEAKFENKKKHGKNQQWPHTTRETEFTDLAKEVIKLPATSEEKLESRVATTCYLKRPIFNKKL